MKKYITFFLFTALTVCGSAQKNNMLLRHDTTVLNADECWWLVAVTAAQNKPVPQAILEAIQSGKLKAFDPQTNEIIPGKKIFTWQQSTDTTLVWDEKKQENAVKIIQHSLNVDNISRIRVYQDWNFDIQTGKLQSEVKWFELMAEVHTPSGMFLGYQPFCRIYY